jgi:hypothetical protein
MENEKVRRKGQRVVGVEACAEQGILDMSYRERDALLRDQEFMSEGEGIINLYRCPFCDGMCIVIGRRNGKGEKGE